MVDKKFGEKIKKVFEGTNIEDLFKGGLSEAPKELIQGVLSTVKATKKDVLDTLGSSIQGSLEKVDWDKWSKDILNNYSIDINVKVKFNKKNEKKKPSR